MKRIFLALTLLGAANIQSTSQRNNNFNNPEGWNPPGQGIEAPNGLGTNTNQGTHHESLISTGLKNLIKNIDPKNSDNVSRAEKLKTTTLNAVQSSSGILAPNITSELTQLISRVESEESLFIIGSLLTEILHKVEHYSSLYHQGATIDQTATTPSINSDQSSSKTQQKPSKAAPAKKPVAEKSNQKATYYGGPKILADEVK